MLFSKYSFVSFVHRARPYRFVSLRSSFKDSFRAHVHLQTIDIPSRHPTTQFPIPSTMPKRKRAETAVATPTLSNHAVVEEKPDHCFDILDGEIAKELSPESSGLSSPPSSAEEVGGGSLVSEETAIPIPISKKKAGAAPKKAGAAKKAPAVKKGKKKENDDGSDAEFVELAESGANGKPKKAAAAAKKAPAKKKKAIGDEDGMESEVEEPEERPPAVNSDYLPLPWKGRLGFVFLSS